MSVILTSYTPLDAPGGVPRFNRDLISAFPGAKHYSWWDVPAHDSATLPEWEKARVLNQWLRTTGKIKKDDVIITDGFWGLGLEDFPNVISVAHGNWSHTTKDDVLKGIPPEFPQHHAVQLRYRQEHQKRDGWIVAVSLFIAHQCRIQWDMIMPYIDNGIDIDVFTPDKRLESSSNERLIIHGTTTTNKGFDHIDAVKSAFPNDRVWLLDEAAASLKIDKCAALASADVVVHPSAHEGNSYFVLETLASNVPIVSYDVGLMFDAKIQDADVGEIMLRRDRSPQNTVDAVRRVLSRTRTFGPRKYAMNYSVHRFRNEWKKFVETEFGPIIRQ